MMQDLLLAATAMNGGAFDNLAECHWPRRASR